MPLRALLRFRLVALLLPVAMLAGCDSAENFRPVVLDGDYRITRLEFDSQNNTFGVINVLPYLATTGTPAAPETSLNLFGQSRSYTFVYRLAGEAVRTSVQGKYTSSGATAVTIDFGTNAAAVRRVLLPTSLPFTMTEDGNRLSLSRTHTVSFEELAQLDPTRYRGIGSGTLTGVLHVEAQRVQ